MKMKEALGINPLQAMQEQQMSQRYTQQSLAQSMLATNQAVIKGLGGIQKKAINPNTHEAWSIPLSQLVNLWQAKYGDKWVDVSDLDDDFWPEASARLHRNNKMEACDNDSTPWARLKEDA